MWFALQGLIKEQEANEAENMITTPQFSRFELDWFRLEVLPERFAAHGNQEPSSSNLLRDLVLGTFQLLRHTPITSMGINREALFAMESLEARDALGHRLVPPEHWEGLLEFPIGMRTLVMQVKRPDEFVGHIHVHIEPFPRFHQWGVRISINDHYEISGDDHPVIGCDEAMKILEESMEASMERSDRVIHALLEAR